MIIPRREYRVFAKVERSLRMPQVREVAVIGCRTNAGRTACRRPSCLPTARRLELPDLTEHLRKRLSVQFKVPKQLIIPIACRAIHRRKVLQARCCAAKLEASA